MSPITNLVLPTFKAVSLIFGCSAVFTGAQAIVDPVGFSRSFGLPVSIKRRQNAAAKSNTTTAVSKTATTRTQKPVGGNDSTAESYISLMGVRQLATGITLLTFAYQGKWKEMATILSILGVVVAGTDGFYLWRSGAGKKAAFHAIPGALIAALAAATFVTMS